MGVALLQQSVLARAWELLGFFSKKLDPAKTLYSAYDRELLVCVVGIRHFQFKLEGRQLMLYTDHKLHTNALTKAQSPGPPGSATT